MCGIAGWIGRLDVGEGSVEGLTRALRHRGPDSEGRKIWPEAALLHTRLSIIDLSPAGHQPMANEDDTVWIAFNGEIYNHRDMRARLEQGGHRFRGRSDAEVLPHLYEEHGQGMFQRLRGMFAVALYDTRNRTLLLGRDRFGIKPLFFAVVPGGLVFASEIGALRLFQGVDLSVDRQAVSDFAALNYVPAPMTIFRGIRCLEPGHVLSASYDGSSVSWQVERYHQFHLVPDQGLTIEDAIDRTEELITAGVRSQLESDVPLGCLLSGGIDSSLVSAAAQKALPQALQTCNVQFSDPRYDETWAALAVARHIGSRHQTLPMERDAGTWEGVCALLGHCGQPFADTSVFAVHEICREMRKKVTVALCGDGGDEGFGGYYFHWKAERIASWLRWPGILLRAGSGLAVIPARLKLVSPGFPANLRGYVGAGDADIVQSLMTWLGRQQHRRLCRDRDLQPVGRHFQRRWERDPGPDTARVDDLSTLATEVNIRLVLPNDFLFKSDIASMRIGLELRVPMLDEDLFDFALSLPRGFKVKSRTGKIILRRIAERQLPREVAVKGKMGFGVPVDRWVDADFRRRLGRLLLGPNSVLPEFYDPKEYGPWIQAFVQGRQHPELDRMVLYNCAIMLLAMQVALAPETIRA